MTTAAASRHIPLEGSVNFRDLGGYETVDGRRVKWRRLFRADGLSKLTDSDRDVLRRLGVMTVIDLRTSSELDRGRFPVDEIPVTFHHLPLIDAVPDPHDFEIAPGMLAAQYLEIARDAAPQIIEILSILSEPDSHPAVVHCTAGKDRTGVLVAMLLGLVGVPDETIVADYALSARAMTRLRSRLIEQYPQGRETIEKADALFSAAPTNIIGLLEMVRNRYGTFEAYARDAGASPSLVPALRSQLLEEVVPPAG